MMTVTIWQRRQEQAGRRPIILRKETPMKHKKLFYNGEILTANAFDEIAEALVYEGERILFVGTAAEARQLLDDDTELIDLQGRAMLPGFIDCHFHALSGMSAAAGQLDLSTAPTLSHLLGTIRTAAARLPRGEWIFAAGYDPHRLPEQRHPTREELDAVAPDHPTLLSPDGAHMGVANTAALEAGHFFDGTVSYPADGVVMEADSPTGLLLEDAYFTLLSRSPLSGSDGQLLSRLQETYRQLSAHGITGLHEAGGLGAAALRVLQQARKAHLLTARTYAMLWSCYGKAVQEQLCGHAFSLGIFSGLGDDLLRVGPVKLLLDGPLPTPASPPSPPTADAIFAHAALRAPDRNSTHLAPLHYPKEALVQAVIEAHRAGCQIAAHALGDRALEALLDACEAAGAAAPRADCRHRVEHCLVCPPDLQQRIAAQKMVPVLGPAFLSRPGELWRTQAEAQSHPHLLPLRSLLDAGIPCAFGSDSTEAQLTPPLCTIAAAIDRKLPDGTRLSPEQGITLPEAVRCHTLNGAYACFAEDAYGSLEWGKYADLVILSDAITDKTPDEIRELQVERTVFAGKTVYDRQSAPQTTPQQSQLVLV